MKKNTTLRPEMLDNASSKSYEACTNISTALNATLESSTYPDLFAYYHGQHTTLIGAYAALRFQVAKRKSDTVALAKMFKDLPGAAYGWSYDIEAVYAKDSAGYVQLFPNGRRVFSSGSQISRINAISQLSLALTGITALAAVKTSVDAFLTAITAANNAQKGAKSAIDAKRAILDECRRNAVQAQIYVLAELMKEFNNDVEQVNNYFPMELIRRTVQTFFTGKITGITYALVARRTLKPGAEINLKNTGRENAVEYYLSDTSFGDIPEGTTPIVVPPGRGIKVPVEQLGNLANRFLTVRNTVKGDAFWEVSLA